MLHRYGTRLGAGSWQAYYYRRLFNSLWASLEKTSTMWKARGVVAVHGRDILLGETGRCHAYFDCTIYIQHNCCRCFRLYYIYLNPVVQLGYLFAWPS